MFWQPNLTEQSNYQAAQARAKYEADMRNAPKPKEYTQVASGGIGINPLNSAPQVSSHSSDGRVTFTNGTSIGGSSTSIGSGLSTSTSSSSMGDLKNVFTELGNISETKAQNDQRRFREDLPFQSRIYQDFDTEAAKRTEGIDTRAREQNSNLTKDRMRLQSTQNIAEEKNRGQVQVSTTGQTRDADLKRALSVLPRK